jgi:hypothetical protein
MAQKKLNLTQVKKPFTLTKPPKSNNLFGNGLLVLEKFNVTKYQNYLNFALGTVLVIMVGKTIAPNFGPNLIPKIGDSGSPVFGGGSGQSVSFEFGTTTIVDPKYIQAAMKGISGTAIVTDSRGNLIAGQGEDTPMEPMSIAKLFVAHAVIKEKGLTTKLPTFDNQTVATVVGRMIEKSNNVTAEQLADLVGLDKVQELARVSTGNPKLIVGNGSGCNGGTSGTAAIGCGGSGAPLTLVTPREMTLSNIAFNAELKNQGTSFQEYVGTFGKVGSSGQHRFYRDDTDKSEWKNLPVPKIALKTGTRRGFMSASGSIVNKNNEELFFTLMTPGPDTPVWKKQIQVMKAALEGNAKNQAK